MGEQGGVAAFTRRRAPGNAGALDCRWGWQEDCRFPQGTDDGLGDYLALVGGPSRDGCGVDHKSQVGPCGLAQLQNRGDVTGMVRHGLLARGVTVEP